MKGLAEFLVRAKRSTYPSILHDDSHRDTDGIKRFVYEEGNWFYKDECNERQRASLGTEMVWKDHEPVWCMQYYGAMQSESVSPIQVYTFLKHCLGKVTLQYPFRGPGGFIQEGNFLYQCGYDECGISFFRGKEYIYFRDSTRESFIKVFSLTFHGGYI
jgi:hypothetical protein